VYYIRLIFHLPYIRLVAGGVAVVGLVAVVTAVFPTADRQTVAAIGAFVVAALIVVGVYGPPRI
jgi:hypothetical protein